MATKTTKTTPKTTKTKSSEKVAPKNNNHLVGTIVGGIVGALVIIGIIVGVTLIVDSINKAKRVGTYNLTSLYMNNETENSVDLLKSLGLTASVTLEKEGKCSVEIFGEKSACTYTDTELKMTDTDTTTSYTYSNDEITFIKDGNKMTFTRAKE